MTDYAGSLNDKPLKTRWKEFTRAKRLDLRWHLIAAVAQHEGWEESAIALVDEAIMPLLHSHQAEQAIYRGDDKSLAEDGILPSGYSVPLTVAEENRLGEWTAPTAKTIDRWKQHEVITRRDWVGVLAMLQGLMDDKTSEYSATLFDPNIHCDAQRVIAWIDSPERRRAYLAFTEGLERQIAYRFEAAKPVCSEISVIDEAVVVKALFADQMVRTKLGRYLAEEISEGPLFSAIYEAIVPYLAIREPVSNALQKERDFLFDLAVTQDAHRMCDHSKGGINFKEQLPRSKEHVEALLRMAKND